MTYFKFLKKVIKAVDTNVLYAFTININKLDYLFWTTLVPSKKIEKKIFPTREAKVTERILISPHPHSGVVQLA